MPLLSEGSDGLLDEGLCAVEIPLAADHLGGLETDATDLLSLFSTSFTIEAWIDDYGQAAGESVIVRKVDTVAGVRLGWELLLSAPNAAEPGRRLILRTRSIGGTTERSSAPLVLGGWQHVAVAYALRGSNEWPRVRFYVDGQLAGTEQFRGFVPPNLGAAPIQIGRGSAGEGFFGELDDLIIWPTASYAGDSFEPMLCLPDRDALAAWHLDGFWDIDGARYTFSTGRSQLRTRLLAPAQRVPVACAAR